MPQSWNQKNCPIIDEHGVILFITLATVWTAKNTLKAQFRDYNEKNFGFWIIIP